MPENIYIKSIELIKDEIPLKAGIKINFEKSLCILVGDNGVGKTTLLECIGDHFKRKDDSYLKRQGMGKSIAIDKVDGDIPFVYIDFHSDDKKFAGSFSDNISLHLIQMKASSGQVSISLINDAFKDMDKIKNGVVILDEPCRGQSIRNKHRVASLIHGLINKMNCQVILTTHSDTILKSFTETAQYFDVTKNENTSYVDFMLTQLI